MTTKNIIPQADGEGSIGIDGTSWASGVFNTGVFEEIFVGGNGAATLPGSKLEIVDSNNHLNLKVADTISQSVLKFSDVDGLGAAINYDHNADKLHLITDGTAIPANGALSIDSDGNVGIGTTDPDYKLHIVDSTNDGSGGIKVENYKPVIELSDSTTNATATTLTQDNSAFTIANNSVDSLTIDSAGKVGIGTTDPGAKLDLQTSDHPLYIRSGAGANDNLFLFENPAAGPQFRMYEKGTSNVAVKLSTHNDSYFNGGKVGIGTTRPGKKLHVAGDSHHIVIEDTNAIAGKKMRGIYNNNQNLFIGRYTDDFNSFFDDMVIDPNGNVGIGTTSPANNLVIRGSSNSDSTLSNDPPFMVIENSYNNYSKDYIFGGLAFTKTGSSNVNGSLSSGVRAGIVAFYDQAHDFSNTQIDSNVGLGLYLRTSSQNTGDSSTRMTITGSGDVGIGTTIPARLLHLKNSNSAIAFETPIDSNGSAFAQIKSGRDGAAGYSSTLEFATTESTTAVSTFGSNGTGGSGFVTRMLIDSAGNVGIGTTPQEKFHVNGAVKLDDTLTPTTTTNKLYSVSSVLYWGGNRILTGAAAGAGAGSGSGSGGVAIADISGLQTALNNKLDKPTAGSEPTFVDSDINLKTNISLIQSPIKSLESIRGVNFKWKEESKKSGEDQGLIAQEVEKIIPSAVKKGEDGYLKVDYTKLVPFLLEAVKDLSKRVKELEKN